MHRVLPAGLIRTNSACPKSYGVRKHEQAGCGPEYHDGPSSLPAEPLTVLQE